MQDGTKSRSVASGNREDNLRNEQLLKAKGHATAVDEYVQKVVRRLPMANATDVMLAKHGKMAVLWHEKRKFRKLDNSDKLFRECAGFCRRGQEWVLSGDAVTVTGCKSQVYVLTRIFSNEDATAASMVSCVHDVDGNKMTHRRPNQVSVTDIRVICLDACL